MILSWDEKKRLSYGRWVSISHWVKIKGEDRKWYIRLKGGKNWGKWEIIDRAFVLYHRERFLSLEKTIEDVEKGTPEKVMDAILNDINYRNKEIGIQLDSKIAKLNRRK